MSHRQTGDFVITKPSPSLIFWGLGVVWSLLIAAMPVSAAAPVARVDSAQVGFRGVVETGRWTPVTFSVSGTAGTEITPRITSADIEGHPCQLPGTPVVLGSSPSVISMVYQHGPIESPLIIELLSGGQVVSRFELRPGSESQALQTVSQQTDFVLCLGQPQLGFDRAAEISSEIRRTRPDIIAPLLVQNYSPEQLSELPLDARGWEAIDACVITSDCQIPESLGQIIRRWIHEGGRLVMTGGEQATSAASPGLAGWLPVKLNGTTRHRDITTLNRLIPGSSTLRLREGSLQAVRWTAESGVETSDGGLVVRVGESLGTVTAIALDINSEPFVQNSNDRAGDRLGCLTESVPLAGRSANHSKGGGRGQTPAVRPQSHRCL